MGLKHALEEERQKNKAVTEEKDELKAYNSSLKQDLITMQQNQKLLSVGISSPSGESTVLIQKMKSQKQKILQLE